MSKTPKVGISVILINDDNQVLIGKRKGSHGEGLYSIPGGHVEVGEGLTDACYRELEEEIGVNKDRLSHYPIHFVTLSEDFFPENKHYITLYYAIRVENGMPVKNGEPEKCEGWIWCDANELPENLFCDSNRAIKEYLDPSAF